MRSSLAVMDQLPDARSPCGSVTTKAEARMEPTLTWAPFPKSTPLGLISHTCPLDWMRPMMFDPLVSAIRLMVSDCREGCTKLTTSEAPTLNVFQLMVAVSVDWVIVVVVPVCPVWAIWALPELTWPPVSCDHAQGAVASIIK